MVVIRTEIDNDDHNADDWGTSPFPATQVLAIQALLVCPLFFCVSVAAVFLPPPWCPNALRDWVGGWVKWVLGGWVKCDMLDMW